MFFGKVFTNPNVSVIKIEQKQNPDNPAAPEAVYFL
jgi:hypothetical protein